MYFFPERGNFGKPPTRVTQWYIYKLSKYPFKIKDIKIVIFHDFHQTLQGVELLISKFYERFS